MNNSTPSPRRWILHIDMDAFFASVEVLDNPELRGKPVMVGGQPDSRGVVAAASYEARKYGVHSAMSCAQAYRLCPHGIFIHPRHRRYSEISHQIFDIFRQYTPLVEPVSIDEAFLDVTGCERLFGSAVRIGQMIKRRVGEEIGLAASVGIAPNKFLAKIASDLEKPDGFVVIEYGREAETLAGLPVGRLWGVGKVTQQHLARLGIEKVRDILEFPPLVLADHFGSGAQSLIELAQGKDDRPVVTEGDAKSIGAENTFDKDIKDPAELRHQLDLLAEKVARRLRQDGFRARTVHLKARLPDFETVTRSITLPSPTSLTADIRAAAREMLEKRIDRRGRGLRLIGVSVSNFERLDEGQMDLFQDEIRQKSEKLDFLIDELQNKFGSAKIRRAGTFRKNEKDT